MKHSDITHFDEAHVLHELKHYLPSQTPLKDFIHHNSLHAFQHLDFYQAIFKASGIFGFQATFQLNEFRKLFKIKRIRPEIVEFIITRNKGSRAVSEWTEKMLHQKYDCELDPKIGKLRSLWKECYRIDLDNLVQPLLFRILCSYLDQGIALWHFPHVDLGLLEAIRELERNGTTSFFRNERARKLLMDGKCSMSDLLHVLVGDEAWYDRYLFDQQFSHKGWSGIVSAIEDQPHTVLYPKKISLREMIMLELMLEIDAIDSEMGPAWKPLAAMRKIELPDLFTHEPLTELQEVLSLWQDAFEWSYYDEVLSGLKTIRIMVREPGEKEEKSFQAIFCIDEREDSLRRHLEMAEPACETLGCPGFFGVEFYFHPAYGKFYEKLCPAPVTPKYLIKEKEGGEERKHELLYSKKSHHFLEGFIITLSLGFWAAIKLFLNIFRPSMSPAISNAFSHMNLDSDLIIENTDPSQVENGLQVGFTLNEMADRVENLLRGIGLVQHFSSLIYVVGHGSSSANNPHHGAHDCGACSGRPGSVNARVFSFMANHTGVREILDGRGLHIPDQTKFVGGLHDTASDEIAFYDLKSLSAEHQRQHEINALAFEHALNYNAKERSRRFASIDTRQALHKVREAIRRRSVSFFEPRPELGHGTNALCFVGNRHLTKDLFLDRRAFMNSYDYRTDPDGKYLLNVMRPLPPVCGGINLEYYFSRVDNYKMGAGTKLPHNVMGLIGVANSADGDLRPGLPLQMIEVHDPIRLLILVEHHPEVILKTIRTEPSLYDWFDKGWVHLVAIPPDEEKFYFFRNGTFETYEPRLDQVSTLEDIHDFLETAREMESNYIVHATQENLPVHIIKK